jgi:ferredoxin
MNKKGVRNIIKIDEEKCDGCGNCVIACAEGALEIIDGKARLVSETYCDGLGACLGECPQGAITIEEREAEGFDEVAVEHHLQQKGQSEAELPCGCLSASVTQFEGQGDTAAGPCHAVRRQAMLTHWPVQLALVPAAARFLEGADVVLCADCVPFAYADFHRDFLKDHAVLVTCPKLDDTQMRQHTLNELMGYAGIKSLTVIHMEVPCCFGLSRMAQQAIAASGRDIPYKEVTIGVRGDLVPDVVTT